MSANAVYGVGFALLVITLAAIAIHDGAHRCLWCHKRYPTIDERMAHERHHLH